MYAAEAGRLEVCEQKLSYTIFLRHYAPSPPFKSCHPPTDLPIKVGRLLLVGADKADAGEEDRVVSNTLKSLT